MRIKKAFGASADACWYIATFQNVQSCQFCWWFWPVLSGITAWMRAMPLKGSSKLDLLHIGSSISAWLCCALQGYIPVAGAKVTGADSLVIITGL